MEKEKAFPLSNRKKDSLNFIKTVLNKVKNYDIDKLIEMTLACHHVTVDDLGFEQLLFTDKHYIYKEIWKKSIFKTLNEGFLPKHPYKLDWAIEITPFSLSLLLEIETTPPIEAEITLLKEQLSLTEEDIENRFEYITKEIGLDVSYLEKIPKRLRPKTNREQLIQLIKLMQFPPLEDLALFYNKYYQITVTNFEMLGVTLGAKKIDNFPNFNVNFLLNHSYYHLQHISFKKFGLDYFETHPELTKFKNKIKEIRKNAVLDTENYVDVTINPFSGEPLTFTLPEELLQYKMILNDRELSKACGFVCFEEFIPEAKKAANDDIMGFINSINQVKQPQCFILVEGNSEENALPILAFRNNFILRNSNIKVYNCSSKERLYINFKTFRKELPAIKIICLLDSDAKKEKDDIVRMIKNQRDKYHLVYIEQGTFEDIFNLDIAVNVLNILYPEGETITKNDFQEGIRFEKNAEQILKQKKLAAFDKVKFAKAISTAIPIDKYPREILEIFDKAKLFTNKKKFIKD